MEIDPKILEKYWPVENVAIEKVFLQLSSHGRTAAKFSATEGDFVYKIASNYKTADALQKELGVFDFLNAKDFKHISELVKTKDGKLFQQVDGKLVYVLKYIEGENPKSNPVSWKKIGEVTAELHTIQGYPFESDFKPAEIIAKHFPERAATLPFGEEYMKIASTIRDFGSLSKALVHTDISCSNSIETPDGNIIFVDWDDAGMNPAVLDVGFPLISQFISEDGEFQQENAKAFYSAYFSKRKITDEEKDHIFDAALFVALFYIIYGDIEKRWKKIQWAIENKEKLLSVTGI